MKTRIVLRDNLAVPVSQLERCVTALLHRVSAACAGDANAAIARTEVIALAQKHEGWPGEQPEGFVVPSRFSEIETLFEQRHAILLVGEPGTGKSSIAGELARRLRHRRPPFELVRVRQPSDAAVTEERKGARLVFWVDDPLGDFEPRTEAEQRRWLSAIRSLRLREDRRVIVTSRSAYAKEILADPVYEHAYFVVDGAFDDEGRSALLTTHCRVHQLTEPMSSLLVANKAWIVDRLPRPQSYDELTRRLARRDHIELSELESMVEEASEIDFADVVRGVYRAERVSVQRGAFILGWLLAARVGPHDLAGTAGNLEDGLNRDDVDIVAAHRILEEKGWIGPRSGYRGAAVRDSRLQALLSLADDEPRLAKQIGTAVLAHLATAEQADAVGGMVRHFERRQTGWPPEDDVLVDVVRALRTTRESGAGFSAGFPSWHRPSWSAEKLKAARSDPRVQGFARGYVRGELEHLHPLLSDKEKRAIVDLLYEFADVGPVFAGRAREYAYIGWAAAPIAYGRARAPEADLAALADEAVALDAEVRGRAHSEDPYDEDADDNAEIDYWHEQLAPAQALMDAVLTVAPADFALDREDSLTFQRIAASLRQQRRGLPTRRLSENLTEIVRAAPDAVLPDFTAALFPSSKSRPLALEAMSRVSPAQLHDAVRRSVASRDESDGAALAVDDLLAWLVREMLPGHSPAGRTCSVFAVLSALREGPPNQTVLQALSPAERAALAALMGDGATPPESALNILEEIAALRIEESAFAVGPLARVGLLPKNLASELIGVGARAAEAVLAASPDFPDRERDASILAAMRHNRAAVRKAAAKAAAGVDTPRVRRELLGLLRDVTPSVRIEAVEHLASIRDDLALDGIEQALEDQTDTSAAAQHGYFNEWDAEYGVANAGTVALGDASSWPEPLRERARSLSLADRLRYGTPSMIR